MNVKTGGKKKMATMNQQDSTCFEAYTFTQGLIDDLEINSSRGNKFSPFPQKKWETRKPHSPVWRWTGVGAKENFSAKLAMNSKEKGPSTKPM